MACGRVGSTRHFPLPFLIRDASMYTVSLTRWRRLVWMLCILIVDCGNDTFEQHPLKRLPTCSGSAHKNHIILHCFASHRKMLKISKCTVNVRANRFVVHALQSLVLMKQLAQMASLRQIILMTSSLQNWVGKNRCIGWFYVCQQYFVFVSMFLRSFFFLTMFINLMRLKVPLISNQPVFFKDQTSDSRKFFTKWCHCSAGDI